MRVTLVSLASSPPSVRTQRRQARGGAGNAGKETDQSQLVAYALTLCAHIRDEMANQNVRALRRSPAVALFV